MLSWIEVAYRVLVDDFYDFFVDHSRKKVEIWRCTVL